jgi:Tfp pilus assembly protein PilN
VVLGVPLSELNLRRFIIVFGLITVANFTLKDEWNKREAKLQADFDKLQANVQKLERESVSLKKIEEEITSMKEQETALNEKLEVVRKILKDKKNPMQVMLYIAQNMPGNLWLDDFTMESNRMIIKGGAFTYKDISAFYEALKKSVFFGSDLRLVNSQTLTDKASGRRNESFQIEATISHFE